MARAAGQVDIESRVPGGDGLTVSPFARAFAIVIGHEGGFVDDPRDPGGATKYGISQRQYPDLDIRNLTLAQAQQLYFRDYWLPMRGDDLPEAIAIEVFDAAVNHGVRQAGRLMQRALRVADDGYIGPVTIAAARSVDPARFLARFNGERLMFYTDLATWPHHGRGWARRVASQLRRA